jgi:negative regulator of sigma E activity
VIAMRRLVFAGIAFLALATAGGAAKAPDPSPAEIEKIVRTFAETESAFSKARENYTYRQTARIQEFDEAGSPGGKFEMVSDIIFTPAGKRTERVVRAPVTTLMRIQMTPEDEQDIRNVLPFVLTSQDIDEYHVRYLGRQNADEIPCYVFAVKPKTMAQGKRYFQGMVWVDDRDLMIVKTYGRSTGLLKKGTDQQFPKFETYREQIDGKYWFPTYTVANSVLHFEQGDTRVRLSVKYQDYKQFGSESKITVAGEADQTPPPKP